jgi:hypothetical protein
VSYRIQKWKAALARPRLLILLVPLALLIVPWPVGGVVRFLLDLNDSRTSSHLEWESVALRPVQGLLFHKVALEPVPGLVVSAPFAKVRFSWLRLLLLQTRVEAVVADTVTIEWTLSGSADAGLDQAVPTETHVAIAKQALDSIGRVLSASTVQIQSKVWLVSLNGQRLRLNAPRASLAGEQGRWNINLRTDSVLLRSWPMPDGLDITVVLGDSLLVKNLQADMGEGSIRAHGTLGQRGKKSIMNLEVKTIPLEPFGDFALDRGAQWKGFASGKIHWQGRIAHPSSWKAEGSVDLSQVQFLRWNFQREGVFSVFVPDFRNRMVIDKIGVQKFELESSRVEMNNLRIESSDIHATAQGAWTFPDRLQFRITGELSRNLYANLPALTRLGLPKAKGGGGLFHAIFSGSFSQQTLAPVAVSMGTVLHNIFN